MIHLDGHVCGLKVLVTVRGFFGGVLMDSRMLVGWGVFPKAAVALGETDEPGEGAGRRFIWFRQLVTFFMMLSLLG
jgi:hypothetical protein